MEESARTSLGRGLKEAEVKSVVAETAAEEELEWCRDRVCGARDKKWVAAAITTACCVCKDKVL